MVSVAGALFLGSCSSNLDATQFCSRMNDALDAYSVRCAGVAQEWVDSPARRGVRSYGCEQMEKAIAGGRAVFDSSKAQQCVDALTALSCLDDHSGATALCGQAVAGKSGAGGACYSDFDCQSGAHCSAQSGCPGTCDAEIPAGGDCTGTGSRCAAGSSCVSGRCAPDVGQGAECSSARCYAGSSLVCQAATGKCATGATSGPCQSSADCDPAYACVVGRCQARGKLGETCGETGECLVGLSCALAKCVAPKLGDQCGYIGINPVTCLEGVCKLSGAMAQGKCEPAVPVGGNCSLPEQCAYPATCDAATKKCAVVCQEP